MLVATLRASQIVVQQFGNCDISFGMLLVHLEIIVATHHDMILQLTNFFCTFIYVTLYRSGYPSTHGLYLDWLPAVLESTLGCPSRW